METPRRNGADRPPAPVLGAGLAAHAALPDPHAAAALAVPAAALAAPAAAQVAAGWAGVVAVLASPWMAPVLLALGFLGIFFELKHPTLGVAASLGVLALALFFGSHWLVGLAGPVDLLLVGVGIVLIGVEVFVVPGLGVPGVLGLAALVGGIFLSLLGSSPTRPELLNASGVVATAVLLFLGLAYGVIRHLPHSRFLGSGEVAGREAGFLASAPREDLVGRVGEAVTDLRPSGTAAFGDERVDVVSEGGWIARGSSVAVIRSEGYRHVVRETSDEEST
ncbi:MAG TPA: NfeD family protein [Gemmatimonadota bacterium]|nr:NfeD family protein [Gemmatimonadota bacterium]